MFKRFRALLMVCASGLFVSMLAAQTLPPPAPTPVVDPPPPKDLVAARVNAQAIPELAVYRGLMRVPLVRREETRKNVLDFLIDNAIIDQYLIQLKIQVEPKEIDEHINKIKEELRQSPQKQDFKDLLKHLMIDEAELRTELTSALRWDKFVTQQGTDKALREMFDKNVEMFNGSQMHARHILIAVKDGNKAQAKAEMEGIKRSIDNEVAQAMAKLPSNTEEIVRAKERARVLEFEFSKKAKEVSTCPSKKDGGDLGFFPRAGKMVEPFAHAAFALKPFQMSDPVATEFGYHLILAVDYRAGKEVKFEQVKPYVQEVYAERLREAVLAYYKGKSKIEKVEHKGK
jgi:parvulin-like peptidyl-prolyl isomerase